MVSIATAQSFDEMGMNIGNVSRLLKAKARSISPESLTGEKGKDGMDQVGNGMRQTHRGKRSPAAPCLGGGEGGAEAQMGDERVEIAVAVEEGEVIGDAAGGDDSVDGFANRNPAGTEGAVIPGRHYGDLRPAQSHQVQGIQQFFCLLEITFQRKALEHFGQDQIADCDGLDAQETMEPFNFR